MTPGCSCWKLAILRRIVTVLMKYQVCLLVVATLSASSAHAAPPPHEPHQALPTHDRFRNTSVSAPTLQAPGLYRTLGDTIWFGGDDGTGYAVEGGVWDFEGAGGDYQGWTSIDQSAVEQIYFGRVSAADFATDPVSAMMGLGDHQIWCGIHEEDANLLDYATGMGYGNNYQQWARSPRYPVGDVSVSLTYFADVEPGYDKIFLNVLCYDGFGELLPDGVIALYDFTGVIGSPTNPQVWDDGIAAADLPAGTAEVQVELRFVSDWGYSDEDGRYDCVWGAFAADDIDLTVGSEHLLADFESGDDGFTFGVNEGVGRYMGLVDEPTYTDWMDTLGGQIGCTCTLEGWALEFVDEEGSGHPVPGHPSGHMEMAISGIVDRSAYPAGPYNTTLVRRDAFEAMAVQTGTMARLGYMVYPYSTPEHPEPHWSPRMGQDAFLYSSYGRCGEILSNLTTLNGNAGDPIPAGYERMRVTYEVWCSCESFGIPSTVCIDEGATTGTPVMDNVRVGLYPTPDAPVIVEDAGKIWVDGYGQRYPTYLEPADVGNSNVAWDLSPTNVWPDEENDWHGDSALVVGPQVTTEVTRWHAELCVHVARKGPRQDLIPEYLAWKARLTGDPEAGFVCVLMDSLESVAGVYKNKFLSYFHEQDPGFDPAYPDLCTRQEILPDSIWTPGTAIEYYYRSYWYNGGVPPQEYYVTPAYGEFEILPRMRAVPGEPYEVQWPAVLYVDAYNRGAEPYIEATLAHLGLVWDRFDYENACGCYHAPLVRSFGGTTFNPGGYGNNGLTAQQALGYRLILVDSGTFTTGAMEAKDWQLFEDWVAATECGLPGIRRGLVFSGDGIAAIMDGYSDTAGRALLEERLGTTLFSDALNQEFDVWDYCLSLDPSVPNVFAPELPLRVWGNGCPYTYTYNVLGLSGVEGASGNLVFSDGSEDWAFAQVVNEQVVPGDTNVRSTVLGFSLMHMSYDGCLGESCSGDSVCIVEAASDLLGATLGWMTEGADPFVPWSFRCDVDAVDDETHLSGPATYLFPARPNPFQRSAVIRFSLAGSEHVDLKIYDVSGRMVRTLIDHALAGGQEHSAVWDGADDAGRPTAAGVYWAQLATESGFASTRRMIVMR